MLETFKQTQRNTVGLCENKSDRHFDQDYYYNTDCSRIIPNNINNAMKIIPEPRRPSSSSSSSSLNEQHLFFHYLQETHYYEQLQRQRHRYQPSTPHPSSPPFSSLCCFEQNNQKFFEVKGQVRSIEKKQRFLSPTHKGCNGERYDDDEKRKHRRDYYVVEGRRLLQQQQQQHHLGLHPDTKKISQVKRPQGDFKQATCHLNQQEQQEYKNTDKNKMDSEEDVDIKVDDIDVDFSEADDDKEMIKCKFNINDSSSSSGMNSTRSCSISSNSSSRSGSVCSGDEDDVDSGIDGVHHHKDNNNNDENIPLERRRRESRIITTDVSSAQISTDSVTTTVEEEEDNLNNKNTQIKNHDDDVDTDYQEEEEDISKKHKDNKMRETSPGEHCVYYYQNTNTQHDSLCPPPPTQQDEVKKLSAIITNEDTSHNPSPPDLTRKFTNFFIDDILKPEFGKKPFETGTTTICTVNPVGGRLKSFSSSFPFSISSLSHSSLLSSSPSSSLPITSQNSVVSSSEKKKKTVFRYEFDPKKSSPSKRSSAPVLSLDSSHSFQTESVKRQTLSPTSQGTKKDLTTETPIDSNASDNLPNSTGFQFKYPAWVFCTRYSDRPSSGPRSRKMKRKDKKPDEKRPRTAFTPEQLQKLKREFDMGRYLTEERRQSLAKELGLNESQIKIWFQNKRAKMKKVSGSKNPLALQLIAEGLYNHQTNKGSP